MILSCKLLENFSSGMSIYSSFYLYKIPNGLNYNIYILKLRNINPILETYQGEKNLYCVFCVFNINLMRDEVF